MPFKELMRMAEGEAMDEGKGLHIIRKRGTYFGEDE